jgi:hypothetical protein
LSPSTVFGPVQPFGLRSTIIGHGGGATNGSRARAAFWIARMRDNASSNAAAIAWCIVAGTSPSTKIGAWP